MVTVEPSGSLVVGSEKVLGMATMAFCVAIAVVKIGG